MFVILILVLPKLLTLLRKEIIQKIIEGNLEVKFPTIWTVEKQR